MAEYIQGLISYNYASEIDTISYQLPEQLIFPREF